jgi:hypothetical protein
MRPPKNQNAQEKAVHFDFSNPIHLSNSEKKVLKILVGVKQHLIEK